MPPLRNPAPPPTCCPLAPCADSGAASLTPSFPISMPIPGQYPPRLALDLCPHLSGFSPLLLPCPPPPASPGGVRASHSEPAHRVSSSTWTLGPSSLPFVLTSKESLLEPRLAGSSHPVSSEPGTQQAQERQVHRTGKEGLHTCSALSFARTPARLHPREKWCTFSLKSLLPGPGHRLPAPCTTACLPYLMPYIEDFQLNSLEFTARKHPAWILLALTSRAEGCFVFDC